MDVEAYLARIGVAPNEVEVSVEGLELLQRSHLTGIPFENLDVFHRRGAKTGVTWSVPKIVTRGRGGWCYELNGAFAALLTELGFSVKQLGATVLFGDVMAVPDHLAIEIDLDRPYLVDVGFGDSFMKPLPLDSEGPHDGGTGEYGFEFNRDLTTLVAYGSDGAPEPQYRFGSRSFDTTDFEEASRILQTDPEMSWTKTPFATRLLDRGPDRVTLLHDRIKFRRDGVWSERAVATSEWDDQLAQWFGMEP